jgi:hypothetical protein
MRRSSLPALIDTPGLCVRDGHQDHRAAGEPGYPVGGGPLASVAGGGVQQGGADIGGDDDRGHHRDWARAVHPFIGPVPAPDPMPPAEQWHIETLVANHGSAEVRRLLDRWGEIARKISNTDAVIRLAEQSREPGGLAGEALRERLALEDHRKALYEATEDIRAQMSAELGGRAAQ